MLIAALVLVPLAFGLRGTRLRIESYQVVDPDTIAVQVTHGSLDWTRVGDVHETDDAVEIEVRVSTLPVPQTSVGYGLVLTVDLEAPLGERRVIDARDGSDVRRVDSP